MTKESDISVNSHFPQAENEPVIAPALLPYYRPAINEADNAVRLTLAPRRGEILRRNEHGALEYILKESISTNQSDQNETDQKPHQDIPRSA